MKRTLEGTVHDFGRREKEAEATAKTRDAGEIKAAAQIHAHEKATVPDDSEPTHPAVKHSIGHYLEHDGKSMGKRMRVLRHQRRHTAP